jgi:hypothetical protein
LKISIIVVYRLGDLVANAIQKSTNANNSLQRSSSSLRRSGSDYGVGLIDENGHQSSSPDLVNGDGSCKQVDELLARMKDGLNVSIMIVFV